ncbi:MAG: hypothetical protein Q9M13_07005, partial [Mariprofundales bacterium]|nr:hypothetical protein [Mariprofundales bacterium]
MARTEAAVRREQAAAGRERLRKEQAAQREFAREQVQLAKQYMREWEATQRRRMQQARYAAQADAVREREIEKWRQWSERVAEEQRRAFRRQFRVLRREFSETFRYVTGKLRLDRALGPDIRKRLERLQYQFRTLGLDVERALGGSVTDGRRALREYQQALVRLKRDLGSVAELAYVRARMQGVRGSGVASVEEQRRTLRRQFRLIQQEFGTTFQYVTSRLRLDRTLGPDIRRRLERLRYQFRVLGLDVERALTGPVEEGRRALREYRHAVERLKMDLGSVAELAQTQARMRVARGGAASVEEQRRTLRRQFRTLQQEFGETMRHVATKLRLDQAFGPDIRKRLERLRHEFRLLGMDVEKALMGPVAGGRRALQAYQQAVTRLRGELDAVVKLAHVQARVQRMREDTRARTRGMGGGPFGPGAEREMLGALRLLRRGTVLTYHLYVKWLLLSGAIAGATTALSRFALSYSRMLEQAEVGIAGVLTSVARIEDAYGRVVSGAEKFQVAQGIARDVLDELQDRALRSTATLEELATTFQAIAGAGLQAGMSLQDMIDIAELGAVAVGALGLRANQVTQELRDL